MMSRRGQAPTPALESVLRALHTQAAAST
jgi:hypothetical protein